MNTTGYQAYKKAQIQTADQGRLIIMCYEGTIAFLKKGKLAMLENDVKASTEHLTKAQNVLWELTNSLNFDAGEIAYNLEALYNYMIRRIIDAHYHGKPEIIDEVVNFLEELKDSWEKITYKNR